MIEKSKAQGKPALEDAAARTALISVAGPSGGAPEGLKRAAVSKAEEIIKRQLNQALGGRALRVYEWAAINKPAT